ncbi:ABC transporter ATP-binding protein [Planctomycetales bacterium]|nr:ABC transporter ATP-binding protein [Planctomycetales bacterium]GHS97181.1 ABC transporter ATP-binding protein [Planctomycetales bacterium]GHT05654.1 ABC transporter ATP-binding protein [Planctomycetales bacterium]
MLAATGLTKEYRRGGGRRVAFNAVDGVDLTVAKGEIVSVVGRSGSGKSTLLNMLTGLLRPTAGAVLFDGQDIWGWRDAEISRWRNTKIGYMPQGQSLLANLNVLDNVRLPFFLARRDGEITAKALARLAQVGIAHLAANFPAELSGGEARRVALARALINAPELLIADEPTGDLDLATTNEIMKLFAQIVGDGTAVLLVTHEAEAVISPTGARIYEMAGGKLAGRD